MLGRVVVVLAALVGLALAGPVAGAEARLTGHGLEAELWAGVDDADGGPALARLTLRPDLKARFGKRWRAELGLRVEFAGGETGLGTTDTFSDLSRPLLRSDTTRLEIDTATLSWRRRSTVLTLGKQTVAWGKLDGLQVTDRFAPVRQRDFILTDTRPERISRWGARFEHDLGDWRADWALALDPTVSQLARPGDRFFPTAPRNRAGFLAGAALPPVTVSDRNAVFEDATLGLRLSRRLRGADFAVLALSGPDTDPVFAAGGPATSPAVTLDYPRRTLVGITGSRTAGEFVLRGELAHVPDQAVNVAPGLESDDRARWLAGIGADWSAPGDVFVNAQIGIDHIADGAASLTRPGTDTIATLRAQKGFVRDTVYLRGEYIGSLSDGDGVIRPMVEWQATDTVTVKAGADIVFGERDELFGQFRENDRLWVRLTVSL